MRWLFIVWLIWSCSTTRAFSPIPSVQVPPAPEQISIGAESGQSSDVGDYWGQWWARPTIFSSVAQAAFAGLLFILTIVQCFMLLQANRTASMAITKADQAIVKADEANQAANRSAKAAEKANIQTTRTIDMMINAERGRLSYIGGRIDTSCQNVHYMFRNIGKTQLTILEFNAKFEIIKMEKNFPPIFDRPKLIGIINQTINPGEYLSTWSNDIAQRTNIEGLPTSIIDLENRYKIGSEYVLIAQFLLRYRTAFDIDYIFRETIMYGDNYANKIHNPDYREDRPHIYMGHFPSSVIALD